MDWFTSFFEGLGQTIQNAFQSVVSGIGNFFYEGILKHIHEGIVEGLSYLFSEMNGIGTALFELNWVRAVVMLFSKLGFLLFLVGLAVSVFEIAVDHSPGINLRRRILPMIWGLLASLLFSTVPVLLYTFCTDLQLSFSGALIRLFFGKEAGAQGIMSDALGVLSAPAGIIQGLFMLICVGYGTLKCFLDNIKRGGVLLLQIAVGSLHMFSIPRGHSDGFFTWCRGIIGICFTAFMQTTFLILGLATVTVNPLLGAGVILAAGEVPRIAQQFGLETGLKVSVGSAVMQTSRILSVASHAAK